MFAPDDGCLDDNEVAAYVEDKMRPEKRPLIEAHLAQCAYCREIVVAVFKTLVEPCDFVRGREPQK